jgi:alpha-tubulin suppressor-like RCC1 family protein
MENFPFSKEYIGKIKILHVFENIDEEPPFDENGCNAFIVTTEDKVYAYGRNSWSVLGLGPNQPATKFTEIIELSQKRVVDFANGYNHVIARNTIGEIYCWGNNSFGQLGLRHKFDCLKPTLNGISYYEKASGIDCGMHHSLVLTEQGEVYTFGLIKSGLNGHEDELDLIPRKISSLNEKIIAISCGSSFSLALSENGRVYCWGDNEWGQLGNNIRNFFYEPYLVRVNSFIRKICCGYNFSLMLSENGNIYEFGWYVSDDLQYMKRKIPIKRDYNKRFIDIAAHQACGVSMAISEDDVICIWGKMSNNLMPDIKETEYKSLNEIFILNYKMLHSCLKIV